VFIGIRMCGLEVKPKLIEAMHVLTGLNNNEKMLNVVSSCTESTIWTHL